MNKIIVTAVLTSIGILGLQTIYIKSSSPLDLIKTVKLIRGSNSTEEESTEPNATQQIENLTDNFEIIKIETGFIANELWYPSVKVEFKNKTDNDITDYIEVMAIFIDNNTGEQIGTKSSFISSPMKPFVSGLIKKKILYPTIGYRGSITNLNITARVYIENELINSVPIENVELFY